MRYRIAGESPRMDEDVLPNKFGVCPPLRVPLSFPDATILHFALEMNGLSKQTEEAFERML